MFVQLVLTNIFKMPGIIKNNRALAGVALA